MVVVLPTCMLADHAVNMLNNATATPEPTPTAAPTVNPASAVWHTRVYNYDGAHPNRGASTSDMDT